MADPILDNVVRAQCIWEAPSGLPADRFVTSWAFARRAASPAAFNLTSEHVAERLREFWTVPVAGTPGTIAGLMPQSVTQRGLEIRCYDLGQAPPREPRIFEFTTGEGSGAQVLPREVAITCSFYATRNLARQRGRVFLGPFTTQCMGAAGLQTIPEATRLIVGRAAQRLAHSEGLFDSVDWGVLSQKDGQIRPVTHGWVDDAFDTVRKRGQDPQVRTEWGPP